MADQEGVREPVGGSSRPSGRLAFDTEAAKVILGHSKPETTMIYAERDLARAREVVGNID